MSAQIKFSAKNLVNNPVEVVSLVINLGTHGLVERVTDNNGEASISGVDAGNITVSVSKDGYIGQSVSVVVTETDTTVLKSIIMVSTENNEQPKEAIDKVVEPVIDTVIATYNFGNPQTVDEAKKSFKALEDNINNQKDFLATALKEGLTAVAQQQASNLIYTMKTQLQASMDYYVSARSKLNPKHSWVEFRQWCEMSSMIAGIWWLRSNLISYTNMLLTKVEELAQAEVNKIK